MRDAIGSVVARNTSLAFTGYGRSRQISSTSIVVTPQSSPQRSIPESCHTGSAIRIPSRMMITRSIFFETMVLSPYINGPNTRISRPKARL